MVINELQVLMNNVPVGRLSKKQLGLMSFVYDASWLEHPARRPISLSLPLSPNPYKGEIVRNYFQNLLPDSETVLSRIQNRLNLPSLHPFDLLAAVGRDCVGALQFYPINEPVPPIEAVTGTPVTDTDIEQLLQSPQEMPLGMSETNNFRISIAGAQEKTALLNYRNRWMIPSGATPTTHILKLPIGILMGANPIDFSLSCENEWLCMLITRLYGFKTADTQIGRFGSAKALIVRRFDRLLSNDGKKLFRLPTEDLCQALGIPSVNKYEADGGPGIASIMNLLRMSSQSDLDQETFFKTQILFWLLEATDGHAKNFSVFLEKGGGFHLTPLYDIMSTAPLTASGVVSPRRIKMAMGLLGKNKHYRFSDIEPRHFLSTAAAVGLPIAKAQTWLRELAEKTPSVIEAASRQLPPDFPTKVVEPIFTGMATHSEKIRRFLVAQ